MKPDFNFTIESGMEQNTAAQMPRLRFVLILALFFAKNSDGRTRILCSISRRLFSSFFSASLRRTIPGVVSDELEFVELSGLQSAPKIFEPAWQTVPAEGRMPLTKYALMAAAVHSPIPDKDEC
jgi:hypothetical protein